MKGSQAIGYRPDIDGLRAVAVLLVLLFHFGVPGFSGGFVGVDVFFVISGYLITKLIMKERAEGAFSFARFYLRRIRRLMPALFVTIGASLIAGWFLFPPGGYQRLAESAFFAVLSVSNFLFWSEAGYFDIGADLKPLLHTWSLGVEEQFYLLWPLTLVLLLRLSWRHAVVTFLAFAVVASLIMTEVTLRTDPEAAFFLLPYRVMELGLGALVSLLPERRPRVAGVNSLTAVLSLVLIVGPALVYGDETPFPGLYALPVVLGTAALIVIGPDSIVGRVLTLRPVVYVGLISYSLYLVHWPLMVFWSFTADLPLSLPEQAGLMAVSLVLAAGMYHAVEQPFRGRSTLVKIPLLPGRAVVLSAVAGAVLICGASVAIYLQQGIVGRYQNSPEVARFLDSMNENLPAEIRNAQRQLADSDKRMAVVGDSHTGPMWMAVAGWAAENDIKVDMYFLGGGCPSLYGIYVRGDEAQAVACDETKDAAMEEIAAGGYDVVILSSRWGLYTSEISADDPFKMLRPRSLTTDPANGFYPDLGPSREAFIRGLRATVALFAGNGAQVVLVGQAPPVGGELDRCVALQATLAGIERNCHPATREQAIAEVRWATGAAKALNLDALTVIDSVPLFCNVDGCQMTEEGRSLFQDDNHLSLSGGEAMFRGIRPVLEDLLLE